MNTQTHFLTISNAQFGAIILDNLTRAARLAQVQRNASITLSRDEYRTVPAHVAAAALANGVGK